jgi:hypothetical protein
MAKKKHGQAKFSVKAIRADVAPKVVYASAAKTVPTHDEVSARAFDIYEREGRPAGRHVEHWLRAESELS